MRILKIFDGDYPWDIRIEKIARSLLEAGHDVRLVCRNQNGWARRETLPDGTELSRLPKLRGTLTFPFFLNPIWLWHIVREISRFRPDRILVRDLPLAPLGIWLGRRFGIRVIADLAEPYPDSLRARHRYEKLSFASNLVRNPGLADAVERWVMKHIDHALVVCPEAGERLEKRGLPPDRWTEIGNTPIEAQFQADPASAIQLPDAGERFVLFFSGLLAGDRGLEVAVDALAKLESDHPGIFSMVIVGSGPMYEPLQEQARTLGLQEHVHLTGRVDHESLPPMIAQADLGLLPFHNCPHINATLANKLFDYMALGLPVVASDAPPMVRVLRETGAGELFRAEDAQDLARAIAKLWHDPALRKSLGESGLRAARGRYNWNAEVPRLLQAVNSTDIR